MRANFVALGAILGAALLTGPAGAADQQIVWKFDNLKSLAGGTTIHVEGNPKLISTPAGTAVLFGGSPDALFVDKDPLTGDKTFSFEAIIRPDGGPFDQHWFHLSETDPKTGLEITPTGANDPNSRFTFELRVAGDKWYLDAGANSKTGNKALRFQDKQYPLGQWYSVAQTYDGKTYRSYINGELQGEGALDFTPIGPGHGSVGVRINRIDYFQGAVLEARFTDRALSPDEQLKVPPKLNETAKTP